MRHLLCILCLIASVVSPPGAFGASQSPPTGYLVATAHLDTQWRWTVQDTITECIPATLQRNFELLDTFPTYEFSFEGAFRYMLAKEYYPEDYERLKAYIELGRWHVCGSMIESLDVNVPSPESIIRHVLYGNGFFEQEFGTTSCDVFLPDCFGFTYALPTVAAHCGLKGFSTQKLTWGSAVGIPFDVGVWEGVDGSAVIAALDAGSYTTRLESDMSADAGWLKRINKTGNLSGVHVGYKYFGTGDRGGAPSAESVEWAGKSVRGEGPIRVLNCAADQLFHDLTPAQIAALPRYKGELLMTRHGTGCYTSQCAMKRWNRRNELLADAAERACVAADVLGGARYPKHKLREAWIRFLWHQFHDDLTGTSIPEAYRFSWNDEVLSLNQFGAELRNAAGAVARSLDTRVTGIPLIVYNPLAFEREDVVEAVVRFDGPAPQSVQVFDPHGKPVPTQVVSTDGEIVSVLFLARVDSVSFSVFDVRAASQPTTQPSTVAAGPKHIENERYRVRLDEQGDVCSVYDKRLGRELLVGPARLQLLSDGADSWPEWEVRYEDVTAAPFACVGAPARIAVVEQGPVRATVEVTRTAGGSTFVQRISLAAGPAGDRLEFETLIDWQTRGALLKAAFPTTASNPTATYDLGCGTIERPTNTPKLYEVPAQQWADLTDTRGTFGVAIVNDCKYGWDKPDDNTLRLTLIHQPTGVTNDSGWHEMKWALSGHRGDWRESNVPRRAARLNQPLMAFQTDKHDGPLGRAFSLLKLDSAQVCVRALKLAENSDEIVVRLQEAWGRPVDAVRVFFRCPITSARELNGAEKNVRSLDFDDCAVSLDFAKYQIRTIALQPRRLTRSALPVTRPVKLPFNADVVSSDRKRADGDFAGTGHSLPAELLPPIVVSSGIQFHTGPSADGQANAVVCRGQTVALPDGPFSHLYILAAANGTQTATFTVGTARRTLRIRGFSGWIGQADSLAAEGAGGLAEYLRPGFIVPDEVAWVGTHRHDARRDRNEPYVFCYLFKYAIELPPGAASVVLPDNERIVIAAMTAADNPNDLSVAAQLLCDDLRAVRIEPRTTIFVEPFSVQLTTQEPGAAIAYTLDGSIPTANSPRYDSPIEVTQTCTVTARVVGNGTSAKRFARAAFTLVEPRPALEVAGLVPGLTYRCYEGAWRTLPDFDALEPVASGSVDTFDLRIAARDDGYGLVFDGFIDIARTGVYTFQIASDDGGKLYVDGEQVADNDGTHARCTASGRIALARGVHPIRVAFFQRNGDQGLSVRYAGPGIDGQPIPAGVLYRKAE